MQGFDNLESSRGITMTMHGSPCSTSTPDNDLKSSTSFSHSSDLHYLQHCIALINEDIQSPLISEEHQIMISPALGGDTYSTSVVHPAQLWGLPDSSVSGFSSCSLQESTCMMPVETSMSPLGSEFKASSSSQAWPSGLPPRDMIPYDLMQKPPATMAGISMKALGSRMEELLAQCATAIENNDITVAQQFIWVLNNMVSTDGDTNQRMSAYFLRALMLRAARTMTFNPTTNLHHSLDISKSRFLSAIELAGFVDLTPWHRFGFSAANGAIMEALEGKAKVHIVDFSITHCMQWPTLIESLSKRPEGPPRVRLTVHSARPHVPPLLDMSFEEVGMKLAMFARSKQVPFQFNVLPQDIGDISPSCIDVEEGEAFVVNCQMRGRYIFDEAVEHIGCSPRTAFVKLIGELCPDLVTFVDEEANLVSRDVVTRLRAAFNYLWIPFDALETFLPRDSKQRMQYEADIGNKIENIIAYEGMERVERLECKERWMSRLRLSASNLQTVGFSESVVAEVKSMLEEHAAGWGLRKDGHFLLLTWKGHDVVFAAACVPFLT